MNKLDKLYEAITIPIEVGDTLLGGKFKNKRIKVNEIGVNERNEPTVNGRNLMQYRLVPKEIEESLEESLNDKKKIVVDEFNKQSKKSLSSKQYNILNNKSKTLIKFVTSKNGFL